ncbi:hypothetical protein PF005_g23590 [Phytophthora fragariae]|uniref:Uncharacterized protein n=1 Tax=Phytophthora fragariae TaxID=53985 RepID=A0A6A3RRK2_9STRA|nr:hypothetical protein PF009_g17650 [Phytophthora fragariae]KAE8980191.1 hypothetical protein PF011_g22546 [Phytophthora fragariae]KAE9077207.1 hypothetical protein PF007_g24329 [Phytophthora fragariae]KAE9078384.1 hypothetical protein PF010_g23148 [Phytophthora fragariae]KAE9102569.1 hypothetical protein PF006_g22390 [Phytophthora fragariae]
MVLPLSSTVLSMSVALAPVSPPPPRADDMRRCRRSSLVFNALSSACSVTSL